MARRAGRVGIPDDVCCLWRKALCWWFLLLAGVAWAQNDVQPVPALSAHVMDASGTLNETQRKSLDDKLKAFEAASGAQVVVLIVRTTAPEDIASYANRVGNAWKIGRKEVGDGLILLVAKDDRKLRIEVAKTLEGAIPDLAAKQVIDQAITPRFKQGDFAGGIDSGIDKIMALIRHENLPPPPPTPAPEEPQGDTSGGDVLLMYAIMVAVFLVLFGVAGGRAGLWFVLRCTLCGGAIGMANWMQRGDPEGALGWAIGGTVIWAVGEFFRAVAAYRPSTSTVELKKNAGKNPWANASPSSSDSSTSTDSSWFSSSDSSSSSDSFSFSSGGGGDFGGGGASGDW